MFYKVICLINTGAFCASLLQLRKVLKSVSLGRGGGSQQSPVCNELAHKKMLKALHLG